MNNLHISFQIVAMFQPPVPYTFTVRSPNHSPSIRCTVARRVGSKESFPKFRKIGCFT